MQRVPNNNARYYVSEKREFNGNNTFARWNDARTLYVAYSYGKHFPAFVYDAGADQWYRNIDGYSVTTSKHMGQLHPRNGNELVSCAPGTTPYLLRMIERHESIAAPVAA